MEEHHPPHINFHIALLLKLFFSCGQSRLKGADAVRPSSRFSHLRRERSVAWNGPGRSLRTKSTFTLRGAKGPITAAAAMNCGDGDLL